LTPVAEQVTKAGAKITAQARKRAEQMRDRKRERFHGTDASWLQTGSQ
jgi:hypothetical protein